MKKRELEVVVISDVHLGTYGCHAKELNTYLKSINPKKVILLGDIFDFYVFDQRYFKGDQIEFLRNILGLINSGVDVYYLTGNHDEFLRGFEEFSLQNFHKLDKLVLEFNEKRYWFFHGDVFDLSVRGKFGKFATLIGGRAYDFIIILNKWINVLLKKIGRKPYSLSKVIKDSVKKAVVFINDFETISCQHAIKQGYDYVINGHIHQPTIREFKSDDGSVVYMNSGDWIENLTSLEFDGKEWKIFKYE